MALACGRTRLVEQSHRLPKQGVMTIDGAASSQDGLAMCIDVVIKTVVSSFHSWCSVPAPVLSSLFDPTHPRCMRPTIVLRTNS